MFFGGLEGPFPSVLLRTPYGRKAEMGQSASAETEMLVSKQIGFRLGWFGGLVWMYKRDFLQADWV